MCTVRGGSEAVRKSKSGAAKLAGEGNQGRRAAARAWKEEKVPARGGVGSRRSRRLGGALNGNAGQPVGGNSSGGGGAELRQSWR